MKDKRDMEEVLGRVLRMGIILSASVIAIGLTHLFISGQSGYATGIYPTTPLSIISGVLQTKPFAEIMLGLNFLILTPVARMLMALLLFWKERDRIYVGITGIVLAILAVSMALGKMG